MRVERSMRACAVEYPAAKRRRIAVVYHMFPHYRMAIIRELAECQEFDFEFLADARAVHGIEPASLSGNVSFRSSPYSEWRGVLWQPGAVDAAWSGRYDAIIYLANPHFLSTWAGAVLARFRRKKVLFWCHGWLRRERGVKAIVRRLFYRMADQVLVYSERSKQLGVASGYPEYRIQTIYNCLDVGRSRRLFRQLEDAPQQAEELLDSLGLSHPVVICTARITAECRFDLLFEAARVLRDRGAAVSLLLVGEGPLRAQLEQLAQQYGLEVCFYGACYDEEVLAKLIYAARVTVSPGKVGLTAMHSLGYGTPVITHGNFDDQMPEVEAVIPGLTGSFFEQGSVESLADAVEYWIKKPGDRSAERQSCVAVIDEKWNEDNQARLIVDSVRKVFAGDYLKQRSCAGSAK